MDTELLKTVGQIAGIGGVALGVFLLLFRELIRKAILPRLPAREASRFLTLIAVLVWSVALAGIGAWVWTETHEPSSRTPATDIHVQQGVGAGGNIKGSQIRIAAPPADPAASGPAPAPGAGITVRDGVGAGGDIEGSRIDITPPGSVPAPSGGPQDQ
jgi:hypothetical protein